MGVSSMTRVLIGCEQLENRVAYRGFAENCGGASNGRGGAANGDRELNQQSPSRSPLSVVILT